MNTRLLLVDDHRMVLEGLRSLIDQESDLEVVGMAEDGRSALSMIDQLAPDVVVMDIAMKQLNGIEATAHILRDHPDTRIIALSSHTADRQVRAMLDAGAHGYVTKSAASNELLRAIRAVRSGRKFLSSDVTGSVVDALTSGVDEGVSISEPLTRREREVLQLIAEGLTSGEVAARLHISTNTADTHRRNIMKKLDLHGVADLTRYAIREGLTDPRS